MELSLRERVIAALRKVIDPETSLDVWRMKLIRRLDVSKGGEIRLTFRPSSVVCPLGFSLGVGIKEAVQAVEGVGHVHVEVEDYVYAQQLRQLLADMDMNERRS